MKTGPVPVQSDETRTSTRATEPNNHDGQFASTRWTVVFDAAQSKLSPARARSALAQLCTLYWRPIYLFLRRQGYNSEDAQDLTQGFFADLIETRSYARADREKGRFLSFLLGALKHFVAHAREHDRAQKRGGDIIRVPMDEAALAEAETQNKFAHGANPESIYEREWADALLRRALKRLEKECSMAGKSALFGLLKFHLHPENGNVATYESLANQLGRSATTLRSDVARLRARFRAILRDEVGSTVEGSSQVDEELRYLCQVIAAN